MKLLVVILNYNVTDLTIDCLRSLATRIHRIPGARVAVVENGSGGDAAERLRDAIDRNDWGSWVDLTLVHPNRGFTGGNNIAIRDALTWNDPPEYFLLLNADTLALDDTLGPLVSLMDGNPRAGIVGGRVLDANGVAWPAFHFQSLASEFSRALGVGPVSRLLPHGTGTRPVPKAAARVDWVSGACILLRRTMLEETGLLDEGLFTYFDDCDLGWRAKRAGWETWYEPASRVIHFEGAATGVDARTAKRRPPYWYQARRRYFLKNYGAPYTALVDAAFVLGCSVRRVVYLPLRGSRDTAPAHLLRDIITNSVFSAGFALNVVENPALRQRSG